MLLEITSKTDPNCQSNTERFNQIADQALSSTPQQRQELRRLGRDVCSKGCLGVTYEILTTCYPDEFELAHFYADYCSSNERYNCGLSLLLTMDQENVNNSVLCLIQSAYSPGQCPPGCSQTLNRFVRNANCCANNYLRVVDPEVSVEDLYLACGVDNPGFCPNPFEGEIQAIRVSSRDTYNMPWNG